MLSTSLAVEERITTAHRAKLAYDTCVSRPRGRSDTIRKVLSCSSSCRTGRPAWLAARTRAGHR
jgi:hypothetical protein